jgi:hypothetical protein
MRLLQRQFDGSFELIEFVGKDIVPPYAILSHTWGPTKDEITFQELNVGSGTAKPGYRKLNFCADRAAHDDLKFFWIDTCCIDKTNSTELQEAVNCMFRWYKDSAKCYVYLSDVSIDELDNDELAFEESRWFKRGWTLQELLAPGCVEFFSKEGDALGSKSTRVLQIAEITRIPIEALLGKPFSQFGVEERIAWMMKRDTAREEDLAYSLLGLFDIHMPLIYSEGKENALKRLRREIQEETVDLVADHFEPALHIPTMLHETDDQFSILMGNSNKNGSPDLFAVKRTGNTNENIEVNVMYGDERYRKSILRIMTPDFTPLRENWPNRLHFLLTDWTGDGTLDLVVIKKFQTGTNSTEVHILSGTDKFQTILLQVGTPLHETYDNWTFGMGKLVSDHRPDLFAIKKSNTGTNSTEVHVLSGDHDFRAFVLQVGTGLHETDSKFDFTVTDWNGDGLPDLVAIKKCETDGRCAEVHVLSGSSHYEEFILRAEAPIFRSNGMFEFAVADWTGNGKPDLIGFRKRHSETNTTEVHVMRQKG